MSKHDAFDDHGAFDEDDPFDGEEFGEPRGRPPWWSGRAVVASALCLVGVAALGFTVYGASRGDSKAAAYPALPSVVPPTTTAAEPAATTAEPREIVVSVVGAVRQPGLARLVPGARVSDAIEAAGGLRAEAETEELNLAQKLEDGDQVVIGSAPTPVTPAAQRPKAPPVAGSRCDCGGKPAPGGAAKPPARRRQTDVNAATEAELDAVPGIGKGIARAIVQYRAAHGKIRSLDELDKVKQVGAGRLKKLRPYLRV